MDVRIKRVYEPPTESDGYRILVDRLWPRGVSKERAVLDLWLKEVAPTDELRQWFSHDPAKYPEFQKRYIVELAKNPIFKHLQSLVREHQRVTLLYAAHDPEHNQAKVLQAQLARSTV